MIRHVKEHKGKACHECGRIMWTVEVPRFGPLWQCLTCHQSVDAEGTVYTWYRPKIQTGRGIARERKYRGSQPCPRCGQPLWVIEVPNYGSRQQCEDCRISIVSGAVLEWRSAPKS